MSEYNSHKGSDGTFSDNTDAGKAGKSGAPAPSHDTVDPKSVPAGNPLGHAEHGKPGAPGSAADAAKDADRADGKAPG